MSGSQQLLLGGAPQAAPVDPYFYSVTSLLHGDGTNGAQNNTFLDSSTNNFTITRNGNTTQGSFSPFSQTGWGNFFDGTGDYLSAASNAAFALPGAFTFECWFYPRSFDQTASWGDTIFTTTATNGIVIARPTSGTSNTWGVGQVGVAWIILSSTLPTNNQWNHIVVVRDSSNNISLFLNGARLGTTTSSASFAQAAVTIGSDNNAADSFIDGYLSNLRLVKGTAVYDPTASTLTVPTSPLTAITNTSLLTCQANRFLDASTNAFAITRNGDVSVQPFSPFNPLTPYSTSTVGGSGYFDGSGDFLNTPATSQLEFGSGDFTLECWIYPVDTTRRAIYHGSSGTDWSLGIDFQSQKVCIWASSNGTSWNLINADGGGNGIGTITVPLNQWSHIAFVRNGTTWQTYINGVRDLNLTSISGTLVDRSASAKSIGKWFFSNGVGSPTMWNGYISDFRAVKGTAVYTAAFTPPTAPLTAITNTQLLLNYTNAGIFDNAADADYETVGNAQINTSVKKYGTGSMYFDGSGDRLYAPSSQAWNFGTGDFTVELWAYPISQGGHGSSNNDCLVDFRPATGGGAYGTLYIFNNGAGVYWYANTGNRITGGAIPNNTWTHIAISRVASQTKLFLNGTQSGSTYADTTNYLVAPVMVGEFNDGTGAGNFYGYIDDLRISKGVGRYPYNFTPPTAEFPNIGGTVTLTADPYFDYTTLLLPGNGTNGAQNNTFLDGSTNNFTITRNGNTTQGTFSPFSQTGWGNYFDGTGDWISAPSNAVFDFSGDFTIELWFYATTVSPTYQGFCGRRANAASFGPFSMGLNGASVLFSLSTSGSSWALNSTGGTVTANSWNHVAFVRSGTACTAYLNGTSIITGTVSGALASSSQNLAIATFANDGGDAFNGYISNFRVVKGTAVYTAAFTPPTAPLTAITNTSLLTCQSNRFVDNSTNAFAITVNGNTSIQAFSPFNPTAAWSAATYGGSGYFDGSGDYLRIASSQTALQFGTGDFTVEGWVFSTNGTGTYQHILTGGTSWTSGSGGIYWYYNSGSPYIGAAWNQVATNPAVNSGTLPTNAWHHFAFVRNGNTLTLYVNGTSVDTLDVTGVSLAVNNQSQTNIGGGGWDNDYAGYLSNLRVVKGTAVYTANFTVPTAPLTAITNTSLLTNFTNAGIYDATSKNDLETVGNAQISTTQSKFGGSSIYFDGNDDVLTTFQQKEYYAQRGDFTIECWVYPTNPANGTYQYFGSAEGNPYFQIGLASNGKFVFAKGYFSDLVQSVSAATANTWYHVAITRYGSTCTLWVNGVSQGTATDSSACTITGTNPYSVGALWSGGSILYEFSGYMNDFRYTRGIARYTSNFTPPTTAFLTL